MPSSHEQTRSSFSFGPNQATLLAPAPMFIVFCNVPASSSTCCGHDIITYFSFKFFSFTFSLFDFLVYISEHMGEIAGTWVKDITKAPSQVGPVRLEHAAASLPLTGLYSNASQGLSRDMDHKQWKEGGEQRKEEEEQGGTLHHPTSRQSEQWTCATMRRICVLASLRSCALFIEDDNINIIAIYLP